MITKNKAILKLTLLFVFLVNTHNALAQAPVTQSTIVINSFTGIYHLSRDANNRSLLTTEEVIATDFPSGSNFYGITRSIPKTYQGRNVEIKILGVSDTGGSPLPYKTTTDNKGNLVVTTGDPQITIYGLQTFHIRYQTSGVIDIKPSQNTLLLNVNGRGWDQSIGQVTGTIYMPLNLVSSLESHPICYLGLLSAISYDCSINSNIQDGAIVVSAKSSSSVAAHQALVMKLNFKAATFTNKRKSSTVELASISVLVLAGGLLIFRKFLRR